MISRAITARDLLRTVAEHIYCPEVAPTTRTKIRCELKRWEKLTANPPIDQICKVTLRGFRSGLLEAGYAPDTIVTSLETVQTILREASDEWDLLDAVPRIGKGRISRKIPEPAGATVEQVGGAFGCADRATWPRLSVSTGTFWRAWIALTAWTGLRLSDSLLKLEWKHVRRKDRCILFVAGKTRRHHKRHVFPLPDWLASLLEPMNACGSERVFPVPDTMTRFRDHLRGLCRDAGVDDFTPQNLRQFAVTQWTIADRTAGELVHGCGLPKVLTHYLGVLRILEAAEENVVMPEAFKA
jgi:integrase